MVSYHNNYSSKNIPDSFMANKSKFKIFRSWVLWFPDLFLDVCKPERGGIRLGLDQRIFLRSMTRFYSVYGVFPRGYGKTWGEFTANFIIAMVFPNIKLSITAQTKENAAAILSDKFNELMEQYPILKNEIVEKECKFAQNAAQVKLKNNACISILANQQSSKGQRRHRLTIEESALVDNIMYEDVLKPIPSMPRYTCGELAIVNPEELNGQTMFFTTPFWRGSDEFERSLKMVKQMENLQGAIVLGADWMLACHANRGYTKSQILQIRDEISPIAFAQNYGGEWTGSGSGALVDMKKLIERRKLEEPILRMNKQTEEFYIAYDVARSDGEKNNQSALIVLKVIRDNDTNKILNIDGVNVMNVSNTLQFSKQAEIIKKAYAAYNPKMVIVDGNGTGAGLIEFLTKDTYDSQTGEYLGCFDTINDENQPESKSAKKCLFNLKASGIQNKIIVDFISCVTENQLRLLVHKDDKDFTLDDMKNNVSRINPYIQTDLLVEEIGNLKLIITDKTKDATVKQLTKKIDKDRFSALSYGIYYIMEYTSKLKVKKTTEDDYMSMYHYKAPKRSHNIFS